MTTADPRCTRCKKGPARPGFQWCATCLQEANQRSSGHSGPISSTPVTLAIPPDARRLVGEGPAQLQLGS